MKNLKAKILHEWRGSFILNKRYDILNKHENGTIRVINERGGKHDVTMGNYDIMYNKKLYKHLL
jgi:hypothetical protein